MIKAGIIGATGYAGNELVRILMGHIGDLAGNIRHGMGQEMLVVTLREIIIARHAAWMASASRLATHRRSSGL